MNQDDKRKLENELLAMGLSRLQSPELIQQLADMVSAWHGDKQQFFIDLLNECDADKRYEMYQAMAPKLRFQALSYSDCIIAITNKAAEMVSRKQARVEGISPRPINIGNQYDKPQASATLLCYHCKRRSKFCEETPVGAIIKARKAGWVRTAGFDIETCPKCVKKGKSLTQRRVLEVAGNA